MKFIVRTREGDAGAISDGMRVLVGTLEEWKALTKAADRLVDAALTCSSTCALEMEVRRTDGGPIERPAYYARIEDGGSQ